MVPIAGRRVDDPKMISSSEIVEACERLGRLIVQFSSPDAYSPLILQSLNEACRLAQERLQVRFFDHYGTRFDGAILKYLPEIRDLVVDCLSDIDNEAEIGRLPKLKHLHFGVFELNRSDLLSTLQLGQLERLTLAENRNRNIDLAPLSRCASLTGLFIQGHSNGIDAIAGLPRLQKLGLSCYARANPLDFVSSIASLTQLKLLLGGRTQIDDLSSSTIEILQIVRVRGLSTLGDLSRFPSLSALQVEDQLQLACLDLRGANLERLSLSNCRNLVEITGLNLQRRLREFSASTVALDLDELRDRDWPSGTRYVHLFSGNRKWNDDAKLLLASRNFGANGSPWP